MQVSSYIIIYFYSITFTTSTPLQAPTSSLEGNIFSPTLNRNSSALSTLTAGNSSYLNASIYSPTPPIECSADIWGDNIPIDSCRNVVAREIPMDPSPLIFGTRGTEQSDVILPYRYLSGMLIALPNVDFSRSPCENSGERKYQNSRGRLF